jgi:hypothetical protein
MLLVLVVYGPGSLSVDYVLGRKFGAQRERESEIGSRESRAP